MCRICVTGAVEDELHVLLECYLYQTLREKMFRAIRVQTGFDLSVMLDDRDWMKDFLLGCGTSDPTSRLLVSKVVGNYLSQVLKKRETLSRKFLARKL